jgi:hypothetical protein
MKYAITDKEDALVYASAPAGHFALSNGIHMPVTGGGIDRALEQKHTLAVRARVGRAGVASVRGVASAPRCSTAAPGRCGYEYVDPLPYPSSSIRCLHQRRMGAGRFSGSRKHAQEILNRP